MITSVVEHPAILTLCEWLEKEGYIVHKLRVDKKGHVDVDEYRSLLHDRVAIVSMTWANNETGTLLPVLEMAAMAAAKGNSLHRSARHHPLLAVALQHRSRGRSGHRNRPGDHCPIAPALAVLERQGAGGQSRSGFCSDLRLSIRWARCALLRRRCAHSRGHSPARRTSAFPVDQAA